MLVTKKETMQRSAEGIELWNYLTADSGTSLSVAYAELKGAHPESVSPLTDRCYIFIAGEAKVNVGEDTYNVVANDVVYVPKGTKHSLEGIANYFVINNPPYKRGS